MLASVLFSLFVAAAPLQKAAWIGESAEGVPAPVYFRKTVKVSGELESATAYVTAHGIYEASIGGRPLTEDLLTPGWTAYEKRIQYQEYDISDRLSRGANEITVLVTPGWYSSGMNTNRCPGGKRFFYGRDVSLLMEIHLRYRSGRTQVVCTDTSWECSGGPVSFAGIYDGQTIDHTLSFNWRKASLTGPSEGNPALVPTTVAPVRETAVLKPVAVIKTPKGETVLDFGQNLVGWEEFDVAGRRGDTIRIRHAEVLDGKGNFYSTNMRSALTTTTCILSGEGREHFRPNHTFYGFRYIKVEGLRGEIIPEDFRAVAISSDFACKGRFKCSDERVNKLWENITWGFRDNFVDVPTDCPQRDERLGWTGDAEVFFNTATCIGDVDAFFRKWLTDLRLEQYPDGRVPATIPDVRQQPNFESTVAAGWSDASVIIPWQHYQAYGRKDILEDQYESMKSWTMYLADKARANAWLYDGPQKWGDWLSWNPDDDRHGAAAITNKTLIGQAFLISDARTMDKVATILGRKEDAGVFRGIADSARTAFLKEFVTPGGLIASGTQTSYVLALYHDILPVEMRAEALRRLIANIRLYGNHITTGFIGTPLICDVLTDCGRTDVAYELLLQEGIPGWLYPISKGATTVWERWDSIRPDGSIRGGMNSFNHYSFGAIGGWLMSRALGIRPASPGFGKVLVAPHPGGGLRWMEGSRPTPYGTVDVRWETNDSGRISYMKVTVPEGVSARVLLPNGQEYEMGPGSEVFSELTAKPAVERVRPVRR